MPALFLKLPRNILLALCVALAAPTSHAEPPPEPARAETVEKLQERVIELEKETAVLKAELGAQDKRIADGIGLHGADVTKLSNQTSMLGVFITVLTVLVAIVGILGSIFAFKRAEQIAKEQSEKWFKDNEAKLREEINVLEIKAQTACAVIAGHEKQVADKAYEVNQVFARVESGAADSKPTSPEDKKTLETLAAEQESKPRSQWTSDDFRLQALNFFAIQDYEAALKAFSAEVQILDGSSHSDDEIKLAKALVNKGVVLSRLNRWEEAIVVYDEVVRRFGMRDEPELLERVAKALINKGFHLDQLNRPEDAIDAYDKVLKRFDSRSEPGLLVAIAQALVNKGTSLGRLNRFDEEIDAYNKVVERFGTRSELALLERVAEALVSKGITLGQLNRPEEAIDAYDEVERRFGTRSEPELLEYVAEARSLLSKLKSEQE